MNEAANEKRQINLENKVKSDDFSVKNRKDRDIIVSKFKEGVRKNKAEYYVVTMELRQDGQFGVNDPYADPHLIKHIYKGEDNKSVTISKSQYEAIMDAAGENIVQDGKITCMAVSGNLMRLQRAACDENGQRIIGEDGKAVMEDSGLMLNTKTVKPATVPFDAEALKNHRDTVMLNGNDVKDLQSLMRDANTITAALNARFAANVQPNVRPAIEAPLDNRREFIGIPMYESAVGVMPVRPNDTYYGRLGTTSFMQCQCDAANMSVDDMLKQVNVYNSGRYDRKTSYTHLNFENNEISIPLRPDGVVDISKLKDCAHCEIDSKTTNSGKAIAYAFSAEVDNSGRIKWDTIGKSSKYSDILPKQAADKACDFSSVGSLAAMDNEEAKSMFSDKDYKSFKNKLENQKADLKAKYPISSNLNARLTAGMQIGSDISAETTSISHSVTD